MRWNSVKSETYIPLLDFGRDRPWSCRSQSVWVRPFLHVSFLLVPWSRRIWTWFSRHLSPWLHHCWRSTADTKWNTLEFQLYTFLKVTCVVKLLSLDPALALPVTWPANTDSTLLKNELFPAPRICSLHFDIQTLESYQFLREVEHLCCQCQRPQWSHESLFLSSV